MMLDEPIILKSSFSFIAGNMKEVFPENVTERLFGTFV